MVPGEVPGEGELSKGLMSQTTLYWDFSLKRVCKVICDANPVANPFSFIARSWMKSLPVFHSFIA